MNSPEPLPTLPDQTWVRSDAGRLRPSAPASVWFAVLATWLGAVASMGIVLLSTAMAFAMRDLIGEFVAPDDFSLLALLVATCVALTVLSIAASVVAGFALQGRAWAHRTLLVLSGIALLGVLALPLGVAAAASGAVALVALLTPSARAWPRGVRASA